MGFYGCPQDGAQWCGHCYENCKKGSNHKGHWGYHAPRPLPRYKHWEIAEMKRPKPTGADGVAGTPAPGDLFSGCPELWSHMTEDKWEDGGARQRASLLIVCDGPLVKCWLNDRATSRTAWSSGETVEAAVQQMEEQLQTGTTPWRTEEGRRKK